jgi:hypothetical protein
LSTLHFDDGNYAFIPGVFQYSAGVRAFPGYEIVRVRFRELVPLAEAFDRIASHLDEAGRPLASFCACELRSPEPFTDEGFRAFNEIYVGTLEKWGIFRNGVNPIARSNVCPLVAPPRGPSFHAFCFTRRTTDSGSSFVIAGSGEAPEGKANYQDHIVARDDVSPAGLQAKSQFVLAEMERRLAAFGCTWPDAADVQLYTVHDVFPLIEREMLGRGAARRGLTWQFCRPPITRLEFEMDCRTTPVEHIV